MSRCILYFVRVEDKSVSVLVSFLNVEKSRYEEFKGLRLFRFNVPWHSFLTSV